MAKGTRIPKKADRVALPVVRKKILPSMAGAIPGLDPFEEESDDPNRYPENTDR